MSSTMDKTISFLLESDAWVKYNTLIHILKESPDSENCLSLKQEMLNHPRINNILIELSQWPGTPLRNHKDSTHLIHKLSFIADLGFTKDDSAIEVIAEKILDLQSKEGPFQIKLNIPKRYGGTGEDDLAWIICDAPVIIYSLIKFGYQDLPAVRKAVNYLTELVKEYGWGCVSSEIFGKFRGPGRKKDPCPYANLLMLKVYSLLPEYHNHQATQKGIETLNSLWEKRKERKPYLFGIGSDFRKLKAPLIWYDMLHTLDILTLLPGIATNSMVSEMMKILQNKADKNGMFKAESVYRAWNDWDFGQKKEASAWITFLAYRILTRINE